MSADARLDLLVAKATSGLAKAAARAALKALKDAKQAGGSK
ncbi:hypothetical protein [Streptomyces sp. NRRL B-24484]|nr:hypothetical protein [Streptomyces sp. NRRL B-24484]